MATIKEKLYFTYDGVSSKTFGLMHVELGSGMFEEILVADRNINETRNNKNDTGIFNGLESEPISFTLNLAFERGFTDSVLDNVIEWLFKDYYKPLFFEGKEDRIYLCMAEGSSTITHNGLNEGYITVNMRCQSSNLVSPLKTTNLQTVPSTGSITVTVLNDGHKEIYPEISFTKTGVGELLIRKIDTNEIVRVKNLNNNEQIFIDSFKEIIETNAVGKYRYNDVDGDFRELVMKKGQNQYQITGAGKIQFRYRIKYKF